MKCIDHKILRKIDKLLDVLSRCSSGVERFLGKEEVTSSNLVIGSTW